jgi:endonuclease/exonuclease/phosphatase (EEP) superfamily protein YafD
MGHPALMAIGIVALVVSAVALTARYIPSANHPVLITATLAPYLMLGAPLAVILFAVIRNWPVVALSGALAIATAAVQLPWHVATKADGESTVRVVSANLQYGRADPVAVVRLAVEHADIIAVQELTPELADGLSAAGIGDSFPYAAVRAREGPAGVGIWSRYPMRRGKEYDEFWLGLLTAHVRVPGTSNDATVVAAHMSAPWPEPIHSWRADLAQLRDTLLEIGDSATGAVIFAADLNTTPDHLEFRRLLRNGYRDAAEQAGAGLTRTYRASSRRLPALFALDHILTRKCTARTVTTVAIAGSDHRALVADIVVQP